MKIKRFYGILAVFAIVAALLFTCKISLKKSEQVTGKTQSLLDSFSRIKKDESGIFVDGDDLALFLNSYHILDAIYAEIGQDSIDSFLYCQPEMTVFTTGVNQQKAVLQIQKARMYLFVMFSETNGQWLADGYTCLNERYYPEFKIKKSLDSEQCWLVVKHETNQGSDGLSLFDEVWYCFDGSIALQYPLYGATSFFPHEIKNAWVEYEGAVDYDGKNEVNVSYLIRYSYPYKDGMLSTYQTRMEKSYILENHESRVLQATDFGLLDDVINEYRAHLQGRKINALEAWESFIQSCQE